jgi:hemerythrin
MPLVFWNDSLKIGIPEIDSQHKQLTDQLNHLVDAMQANKGKDEIQKIINFLDFYVAKHFSHEEGCMHKYRCPLAATNQAAHTTFIKSLMEIKQEFLQKGSSVQLAIRVNEQLLDWFANHIKKIDTSLKPCMSK